MVYENVIKAIGNTPIVKLNRVTAGVGAQVYAKLEYMNPGGSLKDRIGWWLIEDAETKGLIKPGGTIVEGTSGNTGIGLAIASAIKGYKCIFVLPDKMSQEKIRNLRAFGARVVVTPTAVAPEDPRSYYQVARRIAKETPNSHYVNQYDNIANRECHYKTTGPEILKQIPDVNVFVAGIGTGGTVCGIGRALKENNKEIQVIAVDPIGSIVYDSYKTGKALSPARPYKIEGIGEDYLPGNYDFSVIDDIVQVEDKESFLMCRELLTKEGIYSGTSSGAAVIGALRWIKNQGKAYDGKKVLIILPDSGDRYLSKVYDDDWMREAGFLDRPTLGTVHDLLCLLHMNKKIEIQMAHQTDKISTVIDMMRTKNISQVPVIDSKGWIKGLATEGALLSALYDGRAKPSDTIDRLADPSIEHVTPDEPIEKISKLLTMGKIPLVNNPKKEGELMAIITKIDLLTYLERRQ